MTDSNAPADGPQPIDTLVDAYLAGSPEAQTHETVEEPLPPDLTERLRALGYLD